MNRSRLLTLTLALLLVNVNAYAQNKLLTLDDIYDPEKRLKLLRVSSPELRWLKDGEHYLESREDAQTKLTQLFKVNAATGASAPLLTPRAWNKALAALPGLNRDDAKRLAHLTEHKLNPAENALLINHSRDLFFYDLGSQTAKRLTSTAAAENRRGF
ncbi:MAG: hypothetical protein WKF84_27020 [Pyrinomonadaceae bacterium]